MTQPRMTQAEFDRAVYEFKLWVNNLHAVVNEQLPEGFIYDPEYDEWMKTGHWFTNPRMEAIRKSITHVMGWFDWLEEKLGLPPDAEPSFKRFLSGKCREE
jgi:hypothetical protein